MRYLIGFLFFSLPLQASPLEVAKILSSVEKNFPRILQAKLELENARAKNQMARGGFDSTLEGRVNDRLEGYYDGGVSELKVVKPLQNFNTKVFAGYRVSDGEFPSYEGKMRTLEEGEWSAGVSFSLWRDRDIDEKRLKLWNSLYDVRSAEAKFALTKAKVLSDAVKAYWEWVVAGKVLEVQQNMLEIAQGRRGGLVKRANRGDLARIYIDENDQYILKRQAIALKAEQDFRIAAQILGLYYRGSAGESVIAKLEVLPQVLPRTIEIPESKKKADIERALALNPGLLMNEQKIAQTKNELEFAENRLDPKLDFAIEVSDDQGQGDITRQDQELRGVLRLSIPLERNLGRGATSAANAKLNILNREQKFLKSLLSVEIQSLFIEINTTGEIVENKKKEINIARKLEDAEMKRFRQGASDFFVINIREQNTADAQVNKLEAYLKHQKALAEYQFVLLSLVSEDSSKP